MNEIKEAKFKRSKAKTKVLYILSSYPNNLIRSTLTTCFIGTLIVITITITLYSEVNDI